MALAAKILEWLQREYVFVCVSVSVCGGLSGLWLCVCVCGGGGVLCTFTPTWEARHKFGY